MQKGQYYRLLLSSAANPTKVIAAAKEMQLNLTAQTEESSTKDTAGDALEYEITGQGYSITGSALILTPDDTLGGNTANTLNDMEGYAINANGAGDTILYWQICLMEGTNNRTVKQVLLSGQAKMTQLQLNGQNKQNATYSYTLNGYGAIVVGSAS